MRGTVSISSTPSAASSARTRPDVVDLVREVVNAGASPREEASDGGVRVRWREQLDAAGADEDGRRLDALLGDELAVLEAWRRSVRTYVSTASSRSSTATPT